MSEKKEEQTLEIKNETKQEQVKNKKEEQKNKNSEIATGPDPVIISYTNYDD